MRRKILITGFEPTSIVGPKQAKQLVRRGYELWTFNNDLKRILYASRNFEMHELSVYGSDAVDDASPQPNYLEALRKGIGIPVYHLRKTPKIKGSIAYPRDEMARYFFGKDPAYFTNSFSYMLALAIHEKVDEIHLYGVDMSREHEHAWERPSIEYFLGWARGAGIKVMLPETSDLLKCIGFYGYGENNPYENEAKLRDQLAEVKVAERRYRFDAALMFGAAEDIEYWLRRGFVLGDPKKPTKKILERKKWLLGMAKKYDEYGSQYERIGEKMNHP